MNGAELLMKTAKKSNLEVCFTNFGTTEVPLTVAFDTEPGIRPIMALYEGVCTGAADGWGRMKSKPALTLLHLGPGLANGISTLHDARRAKTPIVNIVGEHMSWHVQADPPLAMNIDALAGTVSGWHRTVKSAPEISSDLMEAISASLYGQISTLIIPNDCQMADVPSPNIPDMNFSFDPPDNQSIEKAAQLLKTHKKVALIIGGRAMRRLGLQTASRIQSVTGCDILTDALPGYMERGGDLPYVIRVPYFPETAIKVLSQYEAAVLAGTQAPVAFFGKEGLPSYLFPSDRPMVQIASERQNPFHALEYLADVLRAPAFKEKAMAAADPPMPQGELNAQVACQTLAAIQPEGAIIVDEGLSSAFPYYMASRECPPHTLLTIAGGSLGYGMPCSIGAATACPDRPVINYQADGSAMYTPQSLWTQAREKLNITTLITSNRAYNILKIEMERAGHKPIGPRALSLIDIMNPNLNWVKLAEGMGVEAVSVHTAQELADQINRTTKEPGPHLIEMVFAG